MKKKRLVVVVQSDVFPIQVEADSKEEAEHLAIQMYEASADLKPTESYYYAEDVLEEN